MPQAINSLKNLLFNGDKMNVHNPITYAIVVTYIPDESPLIALLKSLSSQVTKIVIIDNTPKNDDRLIRQLVCAKTNFDIYSILRLGENFGVATALNIGIDIALSEGADFLLLNDQDSLPSIDMVPNLLKAYQEKSSHEFKVGAVGPTFINNQTQRTHHFRTLLPGHFFYKLRYTSDEVPVIDALTLITSGSLIPSQVLKEVGGMRDDFFIDYVDTEWSLRAKAHGYHLYGIYSAKMIQQLGDKKFRVWLFRWRDESEYSPLRIYYMVRNYVSLCRLKHFSWRIKFASGWYLLGTIYMHVIFGSKRIRSSAMALKGAWHGLTGRMGKH